MARVIEAVFHNGVFRPLQPVDLVEGQKVQVTLPFPQPHSATPEEVKELTRLAHSVFEGLTDEEFEEIAQSWKRQK